MHRIDGKCEERGTCTREPTVTDCFALEFEWLTQGLVSMILVKGEQGCRTLEHACMQAPGDKKD